MSDELELSTQEIQGLADRLDSWDELSDREREVLGGVFALAGAALAGAQGDDEVSGFSFGLSEAPPPGTFGAFSWGADTAKGKGKGNGQIFLRFDFKLVAVKTIS